ncbi:MAG: AAA family ATPase [bacterium]|nr:AAA family ATPase [bacterium]
MIPFNGGQQLSTGRRTGLGSGFGGVIAYLMHGKREDLELAAEAADRVAWTATRNLPVEEPEHAALWMRAWANQNVRVKQPVYHFGASLAPDEHLSREQWEHVADHMLERLGLTEHQAFIALHRDRAHQHIHIAVNRVGPDTRVWKPGWDVFKKQDAARELERELGLRVVPTRRDLRLEQRRANGVRLQRREVEKPFARRVALAALEDFQKAVGWEDLEARLARRGLRLEPAKRGGGVNVSDGHERAGLARVDDTLSGPRLADRYGETLRAYRQRHSHRPKLERPFGRPDVTPAVPLEARAENLVRHLAAQRATWSEDDLRRLSDRDLDGDALLRRSLASDQVVTVGTGPRGEVRFATHDYLDAERGMFAAGDRLAARDQLRLPSDHVATLLEERFAHHLSREQRDAVLHAASRQDLALVVGRAGAGKTRLTRAVADAYHEAGYRVRGAALAGKAAEGLAAEAGIEARTLASYELGWKQGREELTTRDVLLVDEAGMIDVRQTWRVLEHAQARGAKVILVGDPDQLKAIGPGDAFRGLIEQHGAARVDIIRRQADEWQREASEHLADGRLEPALAAYAERGAVQWHTDPEQAREALVMRYFEDRYLAPDQSSLILAHRKADVRLLNERIRETRRGAGELGPGVRLNGREFAAGDRVLFLRNDHSGRSVRTLEGQGEGVKNGALGTLLKAEPRRLRIRLDSGRTVALDPRAYDRLDHGYAATVHKAQGATVDRAYVLADRGFDRNLSYVALTRHRHQLALYVDQETFASDDQLQRVLAREPRKDLARDYRPIHAESLTPDAPLAAEWAPDDSWILDSEPSAELTPVRLGNLQVALDRLEQWDDLDARSKEVAQMRRDLPHHGSLPDLERSIRGLEQPPRDLRQYLARIYRDPAAARQLLDQHTGDIGPAATYRRLAETPESFGRLNGRRVLAQPTRARIEALDVAPRVGAIGLDRRSQLMELREAFEKADRFRVQGLDISRQRGALAPDRDELLGSLRRHAAGIDLAQLEGRLAPRHLTTLRALQRADEIHLAPLRSALETFRVARTSGRSRKTVLRLASNLSALYHATPRKLLRRLTPPQLRLILSATSLAAAVLKKLSPEIRDQDRARRVVLGP